MKSSKGNVSKSKAAVAKDNVFIGKRDKKENHVSDVVMDKSADHQVVVAAPPVVSANNAAPTSDPLPIPASNAADAVVVQASSPSPDVAGKPPTPLVTPTERANEDATRVNATSDNVLHHSYANIPTRSGADVFARGLSDATSMMVDVVVNLDDYKPVVPSKAFIPVGDPEVDVTWDYNHDRVMLKSKRLYKQSDIDVPSKLHDAVLSMSIAVYKEFDHIYVPVDDVVNPNDPSKTYFPIGFQFLPLLNQKISSANRASVIALQAGTNRAADDVEIDAYARAYVKEQKCAMTDYPFLTIELFNYENTPSYVSIEDFISYLRLSATSTASSQETYVAMAGVDVNMLRLQLPKKIGAFRVLYDANRSSLMAYGNAVITAVVRDIRLNYLSVVDTVSTIKTKFHIVSNRQSESKTWLNRVNLEGAAAYFKFMFSHILSPMTFKASIDIDMSMFSLSTYIECLLVPLMLPKTAVTTDVFRAAGNYVLRWGLSSHIAARSAQSRVLMTELRSYVNGDRDFVTEFVNGGNDLGNLTGLLRAYFGTDGGRWKRNESAHDHALTGLFAGKNVHYYDVVDDVIVNETTITVIARNADALMSILANSAVYADHSRDTASSIVDVVTLLRNSLLRHTAICTLFNRIRRVYGILSIIPSHSDADVYNDMLNGVISTYQRFTLPVGALSSALLLHEIENDTRIPFSTSLVSASYHLDDLALEFVDAYDISDFFARSPLYGHVDPTHTVNKSKLDGLKLMSDINPQSSGFVKEFTRILNNHMYKHQINIPNMNTRSSLFNKFNFILRQEMNLFIAGDIARGLCNRILLKSTMVPAAIDGFRRIYHYDGDLAELDRLPQFDYNTMLQLCTSGLWHDTIMRSYDDAGLVIRYPVVVDFKELDYQSYPDLYDLIDASITSVKLSSAVRVYYEHSDRFFDHIIFPSFKQMIRPNIYPVADIRPIKRLTVDDIGDIIKVNIITLSREQIQTILPTDFTRHVVMT